MLRCQIHVFNLPEGIFIPTQRVRGIIKYSVYEEMFLKKIVVSFKGNGVLDVEGKTRRRFRENYVDIDNTIQEDLTGFTLGIGDYEVEFSFQLPTNIPGSIDTKKQTTRHLANCHIQYYVRIKFDRGYLKADKSFKKIVIVKPLLVPSLPMVPVTIEKFKQMDAFVYTGFIQIIASIENSVLYGGETIMIHYKLQNFTNTCLIRILISMVEVHTFKPNRPFINAKSYSDIEGTTYLTEEIPLGENRCDTVQIEVPNNISTSLHSTLVRREYFVKLTVQLPYPHSDVILKMPVEIGIESGSENSISEDPSETPNGNETSMHPYPPPSYQEAMGEMTLVMEETEEDAR